jgi:hypothetical protein
LLCDDGKLLKPETRKILFMPCLTPEAKKGQEAHFTSALGTFLNGPLETPGVDGVEYEYAPGGNVLTNEEGIKGQAEQGLITWGGLPNSFWFIDEKKGIAGVYAAHVYPPGDRPTQQLFKLWHRGVFDMVS